MVSIIVPVYNSEKYIGRCIESLINQTWKDIEIIVINDGSTDKSGDICKKYAENDDRIFYIEQENKGVSVARNAGLQAARGEWIIFVDSDDWAENTMCELAVKKAISFDADIVFLNYYTENGKDGYPSKLIDFPPDTIINDKTLIQAKVISQYAGGNVHNNGVSAGTTWGKLCKKSILEQNNITFVPGLTRAQDTVFWLYVIEYSSIIVILENYLYHYFLSNTSICSGTKFIPNCEIPFINLINEYTFFVNKFHPNEPIFEEALDLRKMQILYWNIEHKYFNKEYGEKFNVIKNEVGELISSDPYSKAIQRVDTDLLPASLRILVICMRRKLVVLYYVLYKSIRFIKDRLNRR